MLFSQRFTLTFAVALWAHSFGDAFLQTLSPRRLLRAPATRMSSFSVTLVDPSGERQTFDCPEDMTIIDGAEEILGIDLPASCRSGSCTSCQGRLIKGEVSQDEAHTLEEEHIEAGYVCTCIAYPTSDLEILTYQEDAFENGEFGPLPAVAAGAAAAPAPAPVAPVTAPAPAPAAVVATGLSGSELRLALGRELSWGTRVAVEAEATGSATPSAWPSGAGSELRSALGRELSWGTRVAFEEGVANPGAVA